MLSSATVRSLYLKSLQLLIYQQVTRKSLPANVKPVRSLPTEVDMKKR